MIDCVSVANMRNSDRMTIESGVSGVELIRRAAYSVFCSVEWKEPIAIVVGSGNNGADGFALAEIFHERGIACTVFTVSDRLHEDAAYYARRCDVCGVSVRAFSEDCLRGFASVVDCMLGTGFSGNVKKTYAEAINAVNECKAFVVSVDINSGMNGDSGTGTTVVRSDHTVTIGFVKRGLILPEAGKYIGKLTCVDIGIALAEREDVICARESPGDGSRSCYLCPQWLDMDVKRYVE